MVIWAAATLVAFFVKGLCGFANTLIFTAILSFGASNVNISPVELVLVYPSNLILVWRERRSIKWNVCLPLSAVVILGCIPGALFLKNADTQAIKLVFGAVIIFIGLELLLRELSTKMVKQSKAAVVIIGLVSGILCGLFGIGALIGACVSRVTDDSSAFKANICFVFAVESTFRLFLYGFWGIITPEIVMQAVLLMPLMLVGLFLGIRSGRFLDERVIRRIVIVMLIVSGIALILNNL